MITLQNISKTFSPGLPSEVKAVQNISIKIEKGEFVILAGSNGSGKSTLLNLISGTLFPDTGKILIDDLDITRSPEHRRAAYISRIFQNPLSGTAPELTVAENFRLAALRSQKKKLRLGLSQQFKKDISIRLARLNLGLENKMNTPIGLLSGGQRQALTLWMAAMSGAKIILLDEPAAALDPKTGLLVMQLADKMIRENNMTAILITHHIKDMLNYGNRLLFMSEGKIVKDISANEKPGLTVNEVVSWFEA